MNPKAAMAMKMIGAKPAGERRDPRQEAIMRLQAMGNTHSRLTRTTSPGHMPQGSSHAGEPLTPPSKYAVRNGDPGDGAAPWWATMPQSMQRGGAGRDVPEMTMPDQRAEALARTRQSMVVNPGAPTRTVNSGDIATTMKRVKSRLRRKGIKGDVTLGYSEGNEPYVKGPRGRGYPVFPSQGA